MLAPKLRSRLEQNNWIESWFLIWDEPQVNCYHWNRELERKGVTFQHFTGTQPWAHTIHISRYSHRWM